MIKPKILLVDDLLENLISLEAVLEDFDIELVRAFSGEEALKLSLKDEFALVILDVHMPGMNGYETLELMQTREFFMAALNSFGSLAAGFLAVWLGVLAARVIP